MSVNIHDIAQRAGVSIATVSRAINGKRPVKEETRQKILHIADELKYKPNPIARSLSRKSTDTIGVILPELTDEFFMDIIHGIDKVAHRNNRFILISSSYSQRNVVETSLEFMSSGRVDGVILMAPSLQNEVIDLLRFSKRPVVLLNCCPSVNNGVSFSIDNYQGAYSIVDHLVSHGYKKIAMVRGPESNADAAARFNGFKKALMDNDLEIISSFLMSADFSVRSGYYAFTRLMSQKEKPDAIFAANDMMAVGVYEAASRVKIRIPDDVAVVGFDDIYLSRLLKPRLTTVHAPIVELGIKAMEYLLKLINENNSKIEPYRENLSTGLVIGRSCGCTNGSEEHIF